jgi:hypothetical protein
MLVYIEALGGQSFQHIMKKGTMTIHIYNEDLIIKELEPEQREANRNILHIPPYIMVLMLLIISNEGNLQKQQKVLRGLHFLLHSDEGLYFRRKLRDISWQILGDQKGAPESYKESRKQESFHDIQKVTHLRIHDAQSKI